MTSEIRVPALDVDSTTTGPVETQSVTIQRLIDQPLGEFREALVRLVTEQLQYREQLLEEARDDLEVTKSELAAHKMALCDASREMDDLRERFEQERRALNDEILRLEAMVRGSAQSA